MIISSWSMIGIIGLLTHVKAAGIFLRDFVWLSVEDSQFSDNGTGTFTFRRNAAQQMWVPSLQAIYYIDWTGLVLNSHQHESGRS